jgi:hypothetical protein
VAATICLTTSAARAGGRPSYAECRSGKVAYGRTTPKEDRSR